MNEKVDRNKIYVSSPTSISIGYNTWFALDTKLVGRIKKLINDCEEKDKEIERLNNNLQSLYNSLEIIDCIQDENVVKMQIRNLLYNYKELKGSDKDE